MYRRELAGDPLSSAALWATHAPLDAPLDDLPEPVSARDFAAQGLLLARRRDYEAAERSFDAALRLEPAHFYWLLADARLLQRTGRVTRAHALIDSRFAAELPSPIVAHELARLRIVLGLSRKASGELVRTLSKFGDEPLLLADRALALAAAEFYGAAASAALRAYELLPDDPFVISVRGATAAKNGREEFAISFLQDALARHADSADIAVALGTALLEAGRPAEAEDVARLASTLDARDGGDAAWRLLADVQRARGDAQGEVDSLSRLVSPHVGEFRWIERRIEHELRRGRDDVAEELWQRATDDAGGLSPLSRAGGERLYAAGRYAEALSVLAALHLRTRTGESALAYSESLWRLASEERDLRRLSVDVLLRAARSVAQRDGELWCKLAEYLAEVGTPQELELLARESQWIRDARFDGWRGVGLHRIGRDDEARRAFASAREIDADGSIALWGEAELLLDTSLPGSDDRRRGLELALQARDVELAHRLGELGVHDAESLLARIERAIERALEDELVPGAAACAEAKRP
jgi:tetratricopeptide (TPR) repeat protein